MQISADRGPEVEITASDIQVSYGKNAALDIEHLQASGKVIGLIGENGSGKSTLIKTILHLLVPKRGEIHIHQAHNGNKILLRPEKDMAFSPENGAVFNDIDVESYLRLWCRLKAGDPRYYRKEGSKYIERLDVSRLFHKLGRELSKGERRRVQTAVGFLTKPKLFLFDEPFDGLDLKQASFLAAILREESSHTCFIVSSHQMGIIERLVDLLIVLSRGQVIACGSVSDVIAQLSPAPDTMAKPSTASLMDAMSYMLMKG